MLNGIICLTESVFIFDSFIWWKYTHKLLFFNRTSYYLSKRRKSTRKLQWEGKYNKNEKKKCTGLNSLIWMEWRVKLCVKNLWTMKCLCNLAIISEQGCNFGETNLTCNFGETKSHLNTCLQENVFKEHWSNFHID